MRDQSDYMDDELHRRGCAESAFEKWTEDTYNRELAEAVVTGWRELCASYEASFPNCDLRDQYTISDVEEIFGL